jgi:hypothetical protein
MKVAPILRYYLQIIVTTKMGFVIGTMVLIITMIVFLIFIVYLILDVMNYSKLKSPTYVVNRTGANGMMIFGIIMIVLLLMLAVGYVFLAWRASRELHRQMEENRPLLDGNSYSNPGCPSGQADVSGRCLPGGPSGIRTDMSRTLSVGDPSMMDSRLPQQPQYAPPSQQSMYPQPQYAPPSVIDSRLPQQPQYAPPSQQSMYSQPQYAQQPIYTQPPQQRTIYQESQVSRVQQLQPSQVQVQVPMLTASLDN